MFSLVHVIRVQLGKMSSVSSVRFVSVGCIIARRLETHLIFHCWLQYKRVTNQLTNHWNKEYMTSTFCHSPSDERIPAIYGHNGLGQISAEDRNYSICACFPQSEQAMLLILYSFTLLCRCSLVWSTWMWKDNDCQSNSKSCR